MPRAFFLGLFLFASLSHSQCDFTRLGSWSPPRSTTLAVDDQHLYLNRGGILMIADRDFSDGIQTLGELPLPGKIEAIYPDSDYLWVASGEAGLSWVDISDPTLPRLINSIDTPGQARELVIQNHYAYVADGAQGLLILDLWNPHQPVEVGRFPFSEDAIDVAVSQNFAYLALGNGGIGVVDISDPRRGHLSSVYATSKAVNQVNTVGEDLFAMIPGYGLRVFSPEGSGILLERKSLRHYYATATFDESYAYILSDKMLTLIDIADPESILPVAWHSLTGGELLDIAVADDSILLITAPDDDSTDQSLVEIHRDDGELTKAPPFLSSISSQSQPHDLAFLGDYAYTAEKWGGLGITDNSDPLHPRYLHSFETTYPITDILVQGNHSYHSWISNYGSEGIGTIDLSDPTNPVEIGPQGGDPGIGGSIFYRPHMAVSGNRGILVTQWEAYGGLSGPEIFVFDLSNPDSHELIAEPFFIDSYTVRIATQNEVLLSTTSGEGFGLLAYDISDSETIIELPKHFPQIANIKGLFFFGDLLLFTADSTFYVADYRNPYSPSLLGAVTNPDFQFGSLITAQGQTAYVGYKNSDRLLQIDLSDPSLPIILKEMSFGFLAQNMASKEGATYLLGKGTQSFQINPAYDSADYQPLIETNTTTLPWSTIDGFDLTVRGETAVVFYRSNFWVIDLTAPQDLEVTGPFTFGGHIASMVVNPPYLYSLESVVEPYQARVIDLADPTSPQEVGEISTGLDHPDQAFLENGHLILLDSEGLAGEQFSLNVPASPQLSNSFDLPGTTESIQNAVIENDWILYSTAEGLYVVDYTEPSNSSDYGFLEEADLWGGLGLRFPYVYFNRLHSDDLTFEIVSFADFEHPERISSTPLEAEQVGSRSLLHESLWIQLGQSPLYKATIHDVSDPYSPKPFETIHPNLRSIRDLKSRGNEILTLDSDQDLKLFKVQCGICQAEEGRLCLGEASRFETSLRWWGPYRGQGGIAGAVQQSPESGLLSWVDPENPEMIVKLLDATDLNDAYWVFAAGATDVGYTLSVEDKVSGELREYRNELGTPACAVTDTGAFPEDSSSRVSSPLTRRSHNTTEATELLLHDARFRLTLEWRGQTGPTENAFTIPHSDKSGFFYWTNPDNLEMVVKVLDGREVNGYFWVFAATSSDVEFRLRVEDTETGQIQEYFNALGEAACSVRDTEAF